MSTRVCTKCNIEFPLTHEFFVSTGKKHNGFRSCCRNCSNADKRKWTAANKEHLKEYNRKYRHNSPAAIIFTEWRKQGCSSCGISDYRVIQAHHIDPSEKEGSAAQMWRVDDLVEELAKCIPLCANCHTLVHSDWEEA